MRRVGLIRPAASVGLAVAFMLPGVALATGLNSASTSNSAPRWVKHVESYPGGISRGVRASLEANAFRSAHPQPASATTSAPVDADNNVQMNTDTNPPYPQNETSVAYSTKNGDVAVAAANDYISSGVIIMRTSDGGRSWKTNFITPAFIFTGDPCNGGDPSVAYSQRDDAFYVGQLCFFRTQAYSAALVFKSVDNGKTWTPGAEGAIAAMNYDPDTQTVDESFFVDKDYITVDNNPSSPHYGRLYVTWTKFHMKPSGFSDYCPIQLAYTDEVPTSDPYYTEFQHTKVVPDAPNSGGRGRSATQFSVPVVEKDGTLDIAYIEENCNDSHDRALFMQKSTDGGDSFLAKPVRVDKSGLWKDNNSSDDALPNKNADGPNTVSLAYSPTTGTLAYAYTNYITQSTTGGDVAVSLSHDGGLTWGATRTVSTTGNGATPARNDQFLPWIASDPEGNFWIIWFDCRRDPNNHNIDTFQAMSSDDGVTWPNVRISSKSWDPDYSFFSSGSFIGDYNGLAVSSTAVYPVWTDGRDSAFGRTGIGETDIFTNYEPRP
jgi:hypothetical protein